MSGRGVIKHVSIWMILALLCACETVPMMPVAQEKPLAQAVANIPLPTVMSLAMHRGQDYYDPNNTKTPIYDTQGKESVRLGSFFHVRDFAHTGDITFRYARIDPKLVTCITQVRGVLNRPMSVNSSYRNWAYNNQLVKEKKSASKKSYHMSGKAADVTVRGVPPKKFAQTLYEVCGCGVGLGVAKNWFHVDTRGSSVRPWGYPSTKVGQLPVVRSVHKKMCGGGKDDFNEIGNQLLRTGSEAVNKTWNFLKSTVQGVLK